MSDAIALEVNGQRIERFLSYRVEADLYVADHAFSLELPPDTGAQIRPGMLAKLYVNDQLELTGIIERRYRRTDKGGSTLQIEGRDLMGLLVSSFCEEFITVEGLTLSQLAGKLLKNVPFINRKQIVYQEDLVGRLKTRRSRHASYGLEAMMAATGAQAERIAQIHPGMTVFQVLSTYALSRGLMFYSLPDGTFVFGRPRVGGEADFTIVFNEEGIGNTVLSSEVEENISQRYSKVTVVGQRQAHVDDGLDIGAANVGGSSSGTVTDPGFPFHKPFVELSQNDSQSPKQHARLLLEKQRHDGLKLCYELPRHSMDGRNFAINRLVHVVDSVNEIAGKPIDGTFLVSGRTFSLDKDGGPTTSLKLTWPGLVEDGGKAGGGRR